MRTLTHLDLFSGIGGFSIAAEWAGYKTIGFCEIDPSPSSVLAHHWPNVTNFKDIKKLCLRAYDCETNPEDTEFVWCNRCDCNFGDCECIGTDAFIDEHGSPDLITGGVPCQPASLIGAQRGTSDERWLWPDTTRVMRELMPRFAVFENPPAILTLESGRAWNGVVSGLAALGYDCWWEVLPASAIGAGHQRERLFLVCADSNRPRLEGHAGNEDGGMAAQSVRSTCPKDVQPITYQAAQWSSAEPDLRPTADGLPSRLVEAALRCVGNSVVPQVAFEILHAIRSVEESQSI